MNNDDENNDEIEVIIKREGISYNELKELHNLSMTTLTNMSRVLPTSTTSTQSPKTLYSSKDVKISKANNNFLIPYHPFKEPCYICKYFGHGMRTCPNIKKEFRSGSYCLNCWDSGHSSGECSSANNKVPPYNENFLSPEEIINRLFY